MFINNYEVVLAGFLNVFCKVTHTKHALRYPSAHQIMDQFHLFLLLLCWFIILTHIGRGEFEEYQNTFTTYLLTSLIGHNNPINAFRPAATHPSRRFYSLRAYASWLHQSMTGLPRSI